MLPPHFQLSGVGYICQGVRKNLNAKLDVISFKLQDFTEYVFTWGGHKSTVSAKMLSNKKGDSKTMDESSNWIESGAHTTLSGDHVVVWLHDCNLN